MTGGIRVSGTSPLFTKLTYQLVPAALITAIITEGEVTYPPYDFLNVPSIEKQRNR